LGLCLIVVLKSYEAGTSAQELWLWVVGAAACLPVLGLGLVLDLARSSRTLGAASNAEALGQALEIAWRAPLETLLGWLWPMSQAWLAAAVVVWSTTHFGLSWWLGLPCCSLAWLGGRLGWLRFTCLTLDSLPKLNHDELAPQAREMP
jgi:hypothetical protein